MNSLQPCSSRFTLIPWRSAGEEEGFTLPEILITLLLCSIIIGMITAVFISYYRGFSVGQSYLDVHHEARTALDWLAKDARWTSKLQWSYGSYVTSNDCVVMEVPAIGSDGDVIDVRNRHDYFIYRRNGGSIERIIVPVPISSGTPSSRTAEIRTVASNVIEFKLAGEITPEKTPTPLASFLPQDLPTVTILKATISTQKKVLSINASDSLTTNVNFRNMR